MPPRVVDVRFQHFSLTDMRAYTAEWCCAYAFYRAVPQGRSDLADRVPSDTWRLAVAEGPCDDGCHAVG